MRQEALSGPFQPALPILALTKKGFTFSTLISTLSLPLSLSLMHARRHTRTNTTHMHTRTHVHTTPYLAVSLEQQSPTRGACWCQPCWQRRSWTHSERLSSSLSSSSWSSWRPPDPALWSRHHPQTCGQHRPWWAFRHHPWEAASPGWRKSAGCPWSGWDLSALTGVLGHGEGWE